jgi:hypothetical protein
MNATCDCATASKVDHPKLDPDYGRHRDAPSAPSALAAPFAPFAPCPLPICLSLGTSYAAYVTGEDLPLIRVPRCFKCRRGRRHLGEMTWVEMASGTRTLWHLVLSPKFM